MANFGIKSTKDGLDVSSSTVTDFTVNSPYNSLKIFLEDFGTASVSTGVVWTDNIVHNLGYKPVVFFYFKHPDNSMWHKAPSYGDINTGADWALAGNVKNTDINTTQLRLYDDSVFDPMPSSPTNVDYKYIIFVDPRKDIWYE